MKLDGVDCQGPKPLQEPREMRSSASTFTAKQSLHSAGLSCAIVCRFALVSIDCCEQTNRAGILSGRRGVVSRAYIYRTHKVTPVHPIHRIWQPLSDPSADQRSRFAPANFILDGVIALTGRRSMTKSCKRRFLLWIQVCCRSSPKRLRLFRDLKYLPQPWSSKRADNVQL